MTPTDTYYHRVHGARLMYVFDGDQAMAQHPNEWSDKPWTDVAAELAEQREAVERAGKVDPPPAPRIHGAHIDDAVEFLVEYAPDLVSAAGHARNDQRLRAIRERDETHAAADREVQTAALERSFGGRSTSKKGTNQ